MWTAARTGSPEVLRVSESSPDTAETSFRELDEVFLQTQTRIWLGEVLHVRFDEDVAISDMLADGELLFQVSKKVWKMLVRKYSEMKYSKVHFYERTSSGKSDGRYMPYPKVDSFLKICQILGLTGVDLFCPSDVVEKRDTRRVCMCIRSLSKKAKLKKLNVPDFDIVTYTIAMPTNLVGGIRRNLELSQCASPSSNGISPRIDLREICGQRILYGQHSQHYDLGSDEAESIFNDLEFQSSFLCSSYNAKSISYLVGEISNGAASVSEEIVPETGIKNTRQNGNHYEGRHEETFFSEAIGSYNLSSREAYTSQILSSSSNSLQDTDQDVKTCSYDIGKRCSLLSNSRNHLEKFDDDNYFLLSESEECMGNVDSNQKDTGNGFKVEGMVDAVEVVTSLNIVPSEHYHHSQSSDPCTISCLEVHNNVEVEPCNNIPETSTSENSKSIKSTSCYKETSDHSISVTSKIYSLDPETDGNDGNLPDEFNSPSILNSCSLYQSICGFESERSCCSIVSRDACSLSFSYPDNQNEMVNAGSSAENGHALLSQHDESCNPAERKSEYYCTDHLILSYSTEKECECFTFTRMYSMCNNENGHEGTNLVANNSVPENDVSTSNFKMNSNEDLINRVVPVMQRNVNSATHSLVSNNAAFSNFKNLVILSSLNSGSEVEVKTDDAKQTDISYHPSFQKQQSLVDLEENLFEEPCVHDFFLRQDSVNQNTLSISSSDMQGEDLGRICGSMIKEWSISDIPCMVFTTPDQQRSPKKDETVENSNVSYNGMSSVNDFDWSDQLKKHRTFADASDNTVLLSIHESKIPVGKLSHIMKMAEKESLDYLELCHFGDGKMSGFRNQMINKLSFCHARDLGVLDVVKSPDIPACSACASEAVPSFDSDSLNSMSSGQNGFQARVETFNMMDILSCSTPVCKEERTGSPDESIIEEKEVVSCMLHAHEYTNNQDPSTAPQFKAELEYEKEIIMLDEEGENKDSKGRVVGKPGSQVLKSVAVVVKMVGALVLVLHLRPKGDKKRNYGTEVPFQTQKPIQELSTYKIQIRMGKSDSLYPGEKLKV